MEIAVAIIGMVAAFLAYHDDYEDGLLGRSSFAVIVLMAVIIVLGRSLGYYRYTGSPEVTTLLWGIAVFMLRHAWRFEAFRRSGRFSWNGRDRRAPRRVGDAQ